MGSDAATNTMGHLPLDGGGREGVLTRTNPAIHPPTPSLPARGRVQIEPA